MAISKLDNVPLIPQPTDGVCWYVSARMLAKWRRATKGGMGTMTDPKEHSDCYSMFQNNAGWNPWQVGLLSSWLNMPTPSITMDFAGVSSALSQHGPIWAAGWKTWSGSPHYHVIVIRGVSDTGVLIHDPEPINVGAYTWKTWSSIKKYVSTKTDVDYNFLVCP